MKKAIDKTKYVRKAKVASDIRKLKNKFYKEIEKLLNKYDVQEEKSELQLENERLKKQIATLNTIRNTSVKVSNQIVSDKSNTGNSVRRPVDQAELADLLRSIGKGMFKNCYDVIARNYDGGSRAVIKEVIREYAIRTTGQSYTEGAISNRASKACRIFRNGWQEEALRLCKNV